MRAVVVDGVIDPSDLRVSEVESSPPRPGEVVIEVRAAACNFSDLLMLRGEYQVKPTPPFIPGREASGVISAVGAGVEKLNVGDRVVAYTDLGAFAEEVRVPQAHVYPLPESVPFHSGAALPIVYPTAYAALVDLAALQPGETLLVHAAAGGVGLAAVQIGRALGARVIATAGGPKKLEIARQAGAEVLIDYREEDFSPRVLSETGGRGADIVYDSVGGETTNRSLRCIAWKGRLVVVGFASGEIPEIGANRIMLKNIAVLGLHWPRYSEEEPETVSTIFAALMELLDRGEIEPLIERVHPLEEAGLALEALARRETVGKRILVP
ncbi:MAG: NADPH:quinone oxidoreductase family protein [Myxococcota bacterium]|jgi:NADPH:quinone reductase|nr:NADPH:quinone oxidoreductase family protein [Myxococcota bacterium]